MPTCVSDGFLSPVSTFDLRQRLPRTGLRTTYRLCPSGDGVGVIANEPSPAPEPDDHDGGDGEGDQGAGDDDGDDVVPQRIVERGELRTPSSTVRRYDERRRAGSA